MRHPHALPRAARRSPASRLTPTLALLLALGAAIGSAQADDTDTRPGAAVGNELAPLVHKGPPPWAGKKARDGLVAVSHPLAAQAGAAMLERGGNAIDAAAAIQFALNVVEPQFSGIGGGGFMMIHLAKEGRSFVVDGRERAPAAATPPMFLLTGVAPADLFTVASTSGLAVGVPGTLAAVDTALRRWGTMKLATTLQPAIGLAEEGFRINRFLAANIAGDGGRTGFQSETAAVFRPGGVKLVEGDLLRQPDLAKTLRLIAEQGPKVFYRGEIAQAIVAAQKRTRSPVPDEGVGRMTLDDLAQYRVEIRRPVTADYRGWQVVSNPPPSSGGLTILQMLEMLERYPLGDAGQGFGFGATKTMHVMIESMRLAFADRAVWMGDEDFVPVPKAGLLDPRYVGERAGTIKLDARMATPAAGNPLPYDVAQRERKVQLEAIPFEEEKGVHTTHYVVADRWGNIVTFTTTIENTWGTGITVPGYGFLLNNELTDFNFAPAFNASTGNPGANDVAPFKRPRSSMAPTLLFKHGRPVAAFGSPGGSTIINSVLNTTLNLVDHGMTIQQAIDAPRLSVTSAGGTVSCEGGASFMQPALPPANLAALAALGHLMPAGNACTASIGSVQGLTVDLQTGEVTGGADLRREGTVIVVPAKKRD